MRARQVYKQAGRCYAGRFLCGVALLAPMPGGVLCLPGQLICGAQSLSMREVGRSESPLSSDPVADARRLIESKDFPRAEILLRDYVQKSDGSAPAHALLGYTLMRLNRPKESLEEYTRAARIERPSAEDLRSVGEDYALLEDLTDADHWTRQALLMNERDPETWYSLGRIRFSLERFQEAVQCFQKTLELLPRSVKAANNLGLAYEGLNHTKEAVEQYRRALAWQAGLPHPSEQPMLNLAIVLAHQGETGEALVLLRQAVSIAPDDPRIHDQLGHVYMRQNALMEAQAEFERAVALRPQSGAYHFLLGQVYRRRGMSLQAKGEFDRAAALTQVHSSAP